jgi:hypothetical protein
MSEADVSEAGTAVSTPKQGKLADGCAGGKVRQTRNTWLAARLLKQTWIMSEHQDLLCRKIDRQHLARHQGM